MWCVPKTLKNMIKSVGIQLEYHNGIQLWEYFWDYNCVPFGSVPLWPYSHLVFNDQWIFAFILICNS